MPTKNLTSLQNPTDGVSAPPYGAPPGRPSESVQKKDRNVGPNVIGDEMAVDVEELVVGGNRKHALDGDKVDDPVHVERPNVGEAETSKPSYASKEAVAQAHEKANPSYFCEGRSCMSRRCVDQPIRIDFFHLIL
ncbi:hypothetical protein V6N12_064882 [Hibiscus sabdariffa]|uniref:Uncharacterized protein n=1 Tax=Hibiscus sabdariffa TaxID=183260 RepID=A0ABR2G804_9ROSI